MLVVERNRLACEWHGRLHLSATSYSASPARFTARDGSLPYYFKTRGPYTLTRAGAGPLSGESSFFEQVAQGQNTLPHASHAPRGASALARGRPAAADTQRVRPEIIASPLFPRGLPMTASTAALTLRADNPDSLTCTLDDRHWRVRGLEGQLSCQRLRVNLLVERRELVHVDTLDLYVARQRKLFIKEAAAELYCDEAAIKQDVGKLLLALETLQEQLIAESAGRREPELPAMTDRERRDAMDLLEDPKLLHRILEDYEACGLVGERVNKLMCYLACTSRLLPRPLAVLVQSSSAAGKTTLLEGTLKFMPEEVVERASALTGQALYYMPREGLKHKILCVAEEQGATEAAYALKLLQSEGRLRIASVGRDSQTGRQRTEHYEVEGPVAMLLTTTAEVPDTELANRCITLSVSEKPEQTATIHARQRSAYLPDAHHANDQVKRQAVQLRHQHAQRLLEPLPVVIPFAQELTFRTDQVRYRRDHAKYLALIASITLLRQYQRKRITRHGETCVVATLEDARLANQLAASTFGLRSDELLPQARQLLDELARFVTKQAELSADSARSSALHAAPAAGKARLERPFAAARARPTRRARIRALLPHAARQPARVPTAL